MVYRFSLFDGAPGFSSRPWLVIGGETERSGGQIGAAVSGAQGISGVFAAVGGYFGTSVEADAGSAYWLKLPAID